MGPALWTHHRIWPSKEKWVCGPVNSEHFAFSYKLLWKWKELKCHGHGIRTRTTNLNPRVFLIIGSKSNIFFCTASVIFFCLTKKTFITGRLMVSSAFSEAWWRGSQVRTAFQSIWMIWLKWKAGASSERKIIPSHTDPHSRFAAWGFQKSTLLKNIKSLLLIQPFFG